MLERKSRFFTSRLRKCSGWKMAGQAALVPFSVKEDLPGPVAVVPARALDVVLERRVVRMLLAAGRGVAADLDRAGPGVDAEEALEERRVGVVPVEELGEVLVERAHHAGVREGED